MISSKAVNTLYFFDTKIKYFFIQKYVAGDIWS